MTHRKRMRRSGERGISLLELTFSTTVLMMAIFATFDFCRLLWAHNAINDGVRKGAEYAISHATGATTTTAIKNLVVYGNAAGGTNPIATGLTTSMVTVDYSSMMLGSGTATVKVTGYNFVFTALIGAHVSLPVYRATLTGETAGNLPPVI